MKIRYHRSASMIPLMSNYKMAYSAKIYRQEDGLLIKGPQIRESIVEIMAINEIHLGSYDQHSWLQVECRTSESKNIELYLCDGRWFGLRTILKGNEDLLMILKAVWH